ncbi:MAG: serine hydroxymethyltransferase [Candidatus Dasytiphilus stammeri]
MIKDKIKLADYDPEIWLILQQEKLRQENSINLIASENYASFSVMQAQGSELTNKYAEGYPGKRYYGGCEYVDQIEELAINRAKHLFNADYANVQPHSGSQANFAIYHALLQPRDLILSMNLTHGGHLTHGYLYNFSGKNYQVIHYRTNSAGDIDYLQLEKLAKSYQPKMIIGGFSAWSGRADWIKMRQITDSVNAFFLVDMSHVAGLVAAGVYPSPLPHAHIVTTTTHKTLGGPRGGLILAQGGSEDLYQKINSAVFPGQQGGPLMHIIAGKAIAFKEAMEPQFRKYQYQVVKNAQAMVEVFLNRHYKVVGGRTFNHMFLLDLRNKNITGKEANTILNKANIIVNKNNIPDDPKSAFITSGIRIGSAAITRRGLKEIQVRKIAGWICDIINNINNLDLIQKVKQEVLSLCKEYPIYNKNE